MQISINDLADHFLSTTREALRLVEINGWTINKHADPTEEAREMLSVDEAAAVADEDPSLIYVDLPTYTPSPNLDPDPGDWYTFEEIRTLLAHHGIHHSVYDSDGRIVPVSWDPATNPNPPVYATRVA